MWSKFNKYKHVGRLYSEIQIEQVWICLGEAQAPVWGLDWDPVLGGQDPVQGLPMDRQTYMTENITYVILLAGGNNVIKVNEIRIAKKASFCHRWW